MTEFFTKDNKVIPISSSKNNLSSKQLGIGNERLTRNDEKVESLMSTKQGGFPPTNRKVGFSKGWDLDSDEFLKAKKMMHDIVEKETGHTLNEGGGFTVTDSINGKEFRTSFIIEPSGKRNGTTRHSKLVITGFKVVLPKEALNKFDDVEKFEKDNDLQVKSDGTGSFFRQWVNVPASNPTKINQIAPFLNGLLEQSLHRQAEKQLAEEEAKVMKANRLDKLRKVHDTVRDDLAREGFKSPSWVKPEDNYESDQGEVLTKRNELLIGEQSSPDRRIVRVITKVSPDGEVKFSIGVDSRDGANDLTEGQMLKIMKVLRGDD